MSHTEDYHRMQNCEYYQSEECDCLTECSFKANESTHSAINKFTTMQEEPRSVASDRTELSTPSEESQEELFRQIVEMFHKQHLEYGRPDYRMLKLHFKVIKR